MKEIIKTGCAVVVGRIRINSTFRIQNLKFYNLCGKN